MTRLRDSWRSLWNEPPGQRFARRYQRLHGTGRGRIGRILRASAGVVLVVVGIIFMPLPGPGFVPVLIGLTLLAGESSRIAHGLDRVELRVRHWLGR